MKSNFKTIILIFLLLSLLSIGASFSYYIFSMNSMKKQLETQSLPLSVDNIYTDIQKHIIEPYLVSSMMANDTFVQDWLLHDEKDVKKIQKYLEKIKNKHGMLAAFLVSQKTQNYYTQDGFVEKIKKSKQENDWYYKFKESQKRHEINLDFNSHINNTIIMFINFKIFDEDFHYLGATGVGIKISYIDDMLKKFRNKYKLKVTFLDKNGNIILGEDHQYGTVENIKDKKSLSGLVDKILMKENTILEYKAKNQNYILETKYIKDLDIHLLVEAKLDDFIADTKINFYINLTISLVLALIIAMIIIRITRQYHKKLQELVELDSLTNIPNRRNFIRRFEDYLLLSRRNNRPISLIFIDIDDFKDINDTLGHNIGDEVLKEIAFVLKNNIRETDLLVRWGGEEFVVAFIDTNEKEAVVIAEKIRDILENDIKIKGIVGKVVTVSIGVTISNDNDTIDTIISRADDAMYRAKNSGKNSIFFGRPNS